MNNDLMGLALSVENMNKTLYTNVVCSEPSLNYDRSDITVLVDWA